MYAVGELLHMVLIIVYHPRLCIIGLCRLAMPYAGFVLLYHRAARLPLWLAFVRVIVCLLCGSFVGELIKVAVGCCTLVNFFYKQC